MTDREYDIVLVGATGYTGSLTAEHIAQHLPTNLKWAVAGRSQEKLGVLTTRLRGLAIDRLQPTIEIVNIEDKSQLETLVRKAKVCISVVSYDSVGAEVIEACIQSRTDYIDTAGSIPCLRKWINEYHDAAQSAGVVLIHSCGTFSAPQDLLTWTSVRELDKNSSLKTKELILSLLSMPSDPSGGTVESIEARESLGAKVLQESEQPWYLSPIKGLELSKSTNFFGMRHDPFLGELSASSMSAAQNRAVIHRTWGLLDGGKDYGPNFQYHEYKKAKSTVAGILQILNSKAIALLLAIAPFRAMAKIILPAPGQGPDLQKERNYRVEMELVAVADTDDDRTAPRVHSRFAYPGGPYHATGAFLAQGAASLLYARELEGGAVGGCLTPAFMGADLIERIQGVGGKLYTMML
ncbi:uncharacterized protein LY89DRAFT_681909 [Mollisia scopiformis]|uniref:Saccharopine dehydrogenase NADP binding domain-containing protein n=1 Tax=Mollisia scopiformis TaxID=149040 RepID=A0A194XMC9_MOLSC|nr:uncharacterized protein LY89DRAFT_681909 [Mollisia scopiformis]KUJ21405.1 hypothetical protein LY89DRAFT_681909 [Mollisia scopiformis]